MYRYKFNGKFGVLLYFSIIYVHMYINMTLRLHQQNEFKNIK